MLGSQNGNDYVLGGSGNDSITGGTGDDFIAGDGGNDTLKAGAGNDTIVAGGGDSVQGSDGNDIIFIDNNNLNDTGDVTIAGGEGAETGAGDTLDLRGLGAVNLTIDALDPEAGTATYSNWDGSVVTINFTQI